MSIFTFQGLGVRVVFIAACCAALPAMAVEPDLSSPQAALKSLNRAVETQDGDAVLKVFYTANDEERGLAQAFSDLILAARKLSDAEKSNYGVAGDVPANGVMSVDELSHLDRAEVKISGDTATLLPVGRLRVIQFHLTQDRWQLVIRDFANAEENLPRQVTILKKVTQVFENVAGEIAAGKFTTSQEAEAAIQTRLATVMIKAATQATGKPTTKPTTKPG